MKYFLPFLLAIHAGVCAQPLVQVRAAGSYSNRVFGEEQGLSQHFIFSLTQDKDGVLHMATEKGLVSFNGDQFLTRTETNGLSENEISCVYSDRHNTTWIGTFHKGICYLAYGKPGIVDSSIASRVCAFTEDKQGRTWGSCTGGGAFYIPALHGKPVFSRGGTAVNGPLICDSLGQLIAATSFGLGIYSIGADNSLVLNYSLPEMQDKRVTAINVGRMFGRDILFVAVENEGVFCYAGETGKYRLQLLLHDEIGAGDAEISSVACDLNNAVWLGSVGNGLRRVQLNSSLAPVLVESYGGLPDENIKSLLVDLENNLWIGTFGHGLVELPYSAFRFYTKENGLLRPDVRCLVEDQSGLLWLGHADGISCFSKEEKKSVAFYNAATGFISAPVNALALDSAGKIWIGTQDGIFRLDPHSKHFENISQRYHLFSKNVNTISVSRDRQVFIGTTDGLYVYNDSAASFRYLTTMDGLMHNNILQLYCDADNNTWFSSAGTPPYYLRNNAFTAFRQIDKLRGYNINGICQDRSKTYWIATDDDGLFSYDPGQAGKSGPGKNFHQYTTANGLRSATCIGVIADTSGMIWVLHRNGVSVRFPGDTVFYALNGMESEMLYNVNPCAYRDRHEALYICTDNGLVEILQQDRSYLRRVPHLSIARFFINGTEQHVSSNYTFAPGTYNLAFEFNSILFSVTTRPVFYYRLLGVDSTWQAVTGRNLVIPNLSAGNYTLQVSPVPHFTPRTSSPEVNIFIDLPFWQKPWFRWTMLVGSPAFVILLIRLQTISLRRRNKKLQWLVEEKTVQLKKERDAVARMNTELQSKNKDITDSIHYAERIQLAILPDRNILEDQFPENFIFFQPRDIVSGDFYWFAHKDGKFITAVIDCTGHGIPGAFMSMIGTTLLNKIVFDYNITGAAEILYQMNEEIIASLHQQDTPESSHDGMDIVLCAFDKERKEVTFAGAGRPLYLVRDGELQEFRLVKAGLGNVYTIGEMEYKEMVIPLAHGDMLYLFSDGYSDQFNPDGRKFSSRGLQNLFKSIAHLPAEKQRERVAETFFSWKKDEFQLDDVLVMGLRVEYAEETNR